MSQIFRLVLYVAGIFLAYFPAHAEYKFDPTYLSESFECDEEWSKERCDKEQLEDAWWNEYGERYEFWYFGLTYDTDIYFARYFIPKQEPSFNDDWDPSEILDTETSNMVDAIHEVFLRRFYGGSAFAVDMVCSKKNHGKDANGKRKKNREWRENCEPILRMVDSRPYDEKKPADVSLKARLDAMPLPTTKAEVAAQLRLSMQWREAKLRQCPAAMSHLLKFPAQTDKLWDRKFLAFLTGKKIPKDPDDDGTIIVTMDGDGVFVRASGRASPHSGFNMRKGDRSGRRSVDTMFVEQHNGGRAYDWVKEMIYLVEPCLTPSTATAPWDKIIAAEQEVTKKSAAK